MKRIDNKIFCAALASLMMFPAFFGANVLKAQEKGTAMPFIRIDRDPVSSGLAGASMTSTHSIAYASFANPAAMVYSDRKFEVAAGYQMWAPSSSSFINAGVSGNIKGKVGITAGFSYGMNPAYEKFNDKGVSQGFYTPSDLQANFGLSWRFLPYLSIGANVKYLHSSLTEEIKQQAVAGDVFLMSNIKNIKAVVGVSSLGTKVKSAGGTAFSLPSSAVIALGYDLHLGEKHEIDFSFDNDVYFSGVYACAVGAAYSFNDMVTVRGGYRYGGKSLIPSYGSVGIGCHLWGVNLDFSYLISSKESPVANTLNIGLGYSF